jgi:hypothetical protein
MKKTVGLSGRIFGKLEVLCFAGKDEHGHALWDCLCECGDNIMVPSHRLLDGSMTSCGCSKEKKNPIIPAKKVCPYTLCPHNVLFQIFEVDHQPVITDWVRENGACMREISPEEERDGVAGMRRGTTQEEIAKIYGIRLFAVQQKETRAFGKLRKAIEGLEKKSEIKLKPAISRRLPWVA